MRHSKLILLSALLLVGCGKNTTSENNSITGGISPSISINNSGTFMSVSSSTNDSTIVDDSKFPNVQGDYLKDEDGYINYQAATFVNKSTEEYYESCVGLSGKELKMELYELIRGHKSINYNGVGGNWASIYRNIDQDPLDSSGINLVYSGVVLADTYFVREHIWPKSLGFPDYTKLEPGIDLHNLHPALSGVNSYRNNMEFDNVTNGATNPYYGFTFEQSGEYVFEPIDSSKGDIARTLFYMAVRYEGKEKINGVIKELPDLELTTEIGKKQENNVWYMGNLETLLLWNELDPVDQAEVERNEKIYSQYQNNRNPFIDHPEYARLIFDREYYSLGGATNLNPSDTKDDLPMPFNSNKGDLLDGTIVTKDVFTETLSGVSTAYKQNVTITTASNNDYLISSGRKSGAFTLGLNNTSDRIATKFQDVIPSINEYTSASSIEMQFDVRDCNGLLINVAEFFPSTAPNFTADFHNWYILKSTDGGLTYELVKSGNLDDVERYQVYYLSDSSDEQVRFAFVIKGNSARLNLTRIATFSNAMLIK